MFKKTRIMSIITLSVLLLLVGCHPKDMSRELLVSAASSMTDSMTAIQELYQKKYPNITLTINFGSSGSLQQQIEQGSPVDVFISASQSKMNNLEEKDLIINSSRKNLLENKLVLIVPIDSNIISSFDDFDVEQITQFAIGEPDSVPAGKYAKEALESLHLYEPLYEKIVFAKNVREVLAWVETNNVDGGLVYETDANTTDRIRIVATATEGTYTPIEYPVAIIKSSKEQTLAQSFVDFLYTKEAIEIFKNYGFHMAN